MKIYSVFLNDDCHFLDWFADKGIELIFINGPDQLPAWETGSFLLLHGGEDIWPGYYDQKPNKYVMKQSASHRDVMEFAILKKAIQETYPIFGICRGAQWLSILAGGALIQHLDGHGENGKHTLRILGEATGGEDRIIWCNTAHHQQMDLRNIPKNNYTVVATHPNKYTKRYGEGNELINSFHEDPEIVMFPEINGYAVQGHPEWMQFNSNFVQFCLEDFTQRFEADLLGELSEEAAA